MASLADNGKNDLQKIRRRVIHRFAKEGSASPCPRYRRDKAVSINMRAFDGDKKISLADLAAVMLRRGEYLCRIRYCRAMETKLALVALQYIVEGEHATMSSAFL